MLMAGHTKNRPELYGTVRTT